LVGCMMRDTTFLHFVVHAVVPRKPGIQRKRKPQGRDGALCGAHAVPGAVRVPGAISAMTRPIGYRRFLQRGAAIDTPPDTISTAFDPPRVVCALSPGDRVFVLSTISIRPPRFAAKSAIARCTGATCAQYSCPVPCPSHRPLGKRSLQVRIFGDGRRARARAGVGARARTRKKTKTKSRVRVKGAAVPAP